MGMDYQIEQAIVAAIQNKNENIALAPKITAWIQAIMESAEMPHDENSYSKRLDIIYDAMKSDDIEED